MISSKQNKQIEYAKKLLTKKGRDESGEFLLEGVKLVSDAFEHGLEVSKLFVTPENAGSFEKYTGRCELLSVTEEVIKVICDAKTNQGVAAVVKMPRSKPYDRRSAVVLDRIQDPKNLGSVLRTAKATGINTVFLIDCADPYSSKALRAGMSGQFTLNLIETDVNEVKKLTEGLRIISADTDGKNVFLFDLAEDFVLVLGNEGGGICNELIEFSSDIVSIPMKNNLESLNIAVSAGILMYQLKKDSRR